MYVGDALVCVWQLVYCRVNAVGAEIPARTLERFEATAGPLEPATALLRLTQCELLLPQFVAAVLDVGFQSGNFLSSEVELRSFGDIKQQSLPVFLAALAMLLDLVALGRIAARELDRARPDVDAFQESSDLLARTLRRLPVVAEITERRFVLLPTLY